MIILKLKYSTPHPVLCATLLINQLTEALDPSNNNKRKVFIIGDKTFSSEPVKFF